MKKYITICVTLAAAIALCGCGDNKTSSKLIGTEMISTTGQGTGNGNGNGNGSGTALSTSQATVLAVQVLSVFESALGSFGTSNPAKNWSSIIRKAALATTTVQGPVSGSAAVSLISETSSSASITEAFSSYTWNDNNVVYVMNGNVNCAMVLTTSTSGTVTITTSGLRYVYGSNSTTVSMNVTISFDEVTGAVSCSGTVNGIFISGTTSM